MLTEIHCEAFGDQKKVLFFPGLNVIQGYSDEADGNGNSIGKTNMLKIIDFAFGGQYYSDSNDDVIRHVGEHDICFTHMFNGKEYRFIRSATARNTVVRCADDSYTPISEFSAKEFCEWLLKQYKVEALQLSFREIVGLYSRIWNKPNKEVNRPLFNHNAQSVTDSIISLVKLFGKYGPIQELHEHDKYLKKRQTVLNSAVSYHLLKVPSKQEYYNYFYPGSTLVEPYSYSWSQSCMKDIEGFEDLQEIGLSFHHPEALDHARTAYETLRERIFELPVLSLLKSPAAYVWTLMLLVFYLIKERKYKGLALTIPLVLSVGVCFLGPCNGDYFRYLYGVSVCLPIVFFQCLCMCKDPQEKEA